MFMRIEVGWVRKQHEYVKPIARYPLLGINFKWLEMEGGAEPHVSMTIILLGWLYDLNI